MKKAPMPRDWRTFKQDLMISYHLPPLKLQFASTWGLFSPENIDEGSDLLLRQLINLPTPPQRILDLGCGYGFLGLSLAKLYPQSQVTLVDKDFVAVEYTRKNIAGNGITNAEVFLSNLYDHIDASESFDLIVSNLPAKISKELFLILFHETHARLRPRGQFVSVCISGLREFLKRHFSEVFGNYQKLAHSKTYTVFLTQKDA